MKTASVLFANQKARNEFYAAFYARIGWSLDEAVEQGMFEDSWIEGSEESSFSGDNAELAADVANEIVGVSCDLSEEEDYFGRRDDDPSLLLHRQHERSATSKQYQR